MQSTAACRRSATCRSRIWSAASTGSFFRATDSNASAWRCGSRQAWRTLSIHRRARIDALRRVAVGLERGEDRVGMGAVAGLDRHVEARPLGRYVEEQPLVIDREDVRPQRTKARGDDAEHAGPVGNGEAERDDAVLALEPAHHDRGEDARIDVAAAQHEAD